MSDLKKALQKTVNYENDTAKGKKSTVVKVADALKLTPIIIESFSK